MANENADIFYQTVSESDIDWLFCMELNSSEAFRNWICQQVFPEIKTFDHVRAWRSVSNSSGESDLVWLIEHESKGRMIVLIENKINAIAQPEQYLRYLQRAEGYLGEGLAQCYSIALLSPNSYRSIDSDSYPIHISYESIVNWLQGNNDERSMYLCSLYEAALNKKLSSPNFDEDIYKFRVGVWSLASSEFSSLNIPEPASNVGGEYWVFMRFPKYTLIYKTYKKKWKFTSSVVDLELQGKGEDIELLKHKYSNHLEGTGISVVKTGKSASFRLEVPVIEPPIYDESKVRIALKAAVVLKEWWESSLE